MGRIKLIVGLVAVFLLGSCSAKPESPPAPTEQEDSTPVVSYRTEEFAGNLEVPWGMAFTSDSRMLVTERPGRLRVIENGALKPVPLHIFPEVSSFGEEGLMSITLDPDYQNNHWIYLSLVYETEDKMILKVVRFTDMKDQLEDAMVIIDDLPAAKFHAGSRIKFGPDKKLYITVGDALDRNQAQKLDSLAGKILRLNKDGSIPDDNPFEGSAIWSYGHRNPQGIAWHPETGEMYSTEHGPSTFDGPRGGDEVNHIVPGGNYGWPLVSHDRNLEGMITPIVQFTPAEPPGSLMIYSGKLFPQFKNNLFFGSLKGEGLMRITLSETDPNHAVSTEKLFAGEFGRIRDIIEGPNGSIYFSTSNQDGRGDPKEGDDKIYKLVIMNPEI
ncbi:MAG: PQQ-dependent sugar dehydrogenase [Candidatus Peregrinibacteria bacterium]|nr:PQQ-dependent sugar dehydrogenase [Candidatus Peregrinibacteria bacterium]